MSSNQILQHSGVCLLSHAQYSIRESQRSKYIRLQVSVEKGLEVIIPKGFDPQQIPGILQGKQRWLNRALERMREQSRRLSSEFLEPLPKAIALSAIQENWQVEYHSAHREGVRVLVPAPGHLLVQGRVDHLERCQQALQQWLRRKAQQHLIPWLQSVSQTTQLPFSRAVVRGQKKRWASCSSRKIINLNYRLLLIPAPLVEYVFVHELCHTVHMNHSAEFWSLVAQYQADYKQRNAELDQAWHLFPLWVR